MQARVSEYCANALHDTVVEEWENQASEDSVGWSERWKFAFSRAFERADETFRSKTLEVRFAGSTACVVVVSPCQIIASNCGDSKAILCRSNEVVPLTFDHKPNRKEEVDRIEEIGGKIFRVNGLRVEGVLAMTRAIGDHDLKPFVISTPDVTYTRRSNEDECLVLATDGLWDVMSIEIVAKLAINRLRAYRSVATSASTPAAAVAQDLVHKALINHSKDNITVTVVDLKPMWRSNGCS